MTSGLLRHSICSESSDLHQTYDDKQLHELLKKLTRNDTRVTTKKQQEGGGRPGKDCPATWLSFTTMREEIKGEGASPCERVEKLERPSAPCVHTSCGFRAWLSVSAEDA